MNLTKRQLLKMYRKMVEIRVFESSLVHYYQEGLLVGTGHPSLGEEAVAVGACSAVGNKDYVLSTHRAHAHVLAKGANMPTIVAELFGKATGCTKGKGGSMHVSDFEHGFLGTSAIVGSGIGICGGIGLGIKLKKEDRICLCFFGDGASNRGTFHEALNLAALWQVPTVFICINNQYAVSTPQYKVCANKDISARAVAYDIPGARIDGTDVISVHETVKNAADRARSGEGPSLIECVTYRLSEQHSMRAVTVPGTEYRPEGELVGWWENHDPVKIFREKLQEMGYINDRQVADIDEQVAKEFQDAVNYALNSAEPQLETAFQDIYVGGTR